MLLVWHLYSSVEHCTEHQYMQRIPNIIHTDSVRTRGNDNEDKCIRLAGFRVRYGICLCRGENSQSLLRAFSCFVI